MKRRSRQLSFKQFTGRLRARFVSKGLTMSFMRLLCLSLALLLTGLGAIGLQSYGQETDPDAEAARQKQVMERFLGVLEKNPRRGTALDRVYGYHVEWGSLEKFLGELKARTQKDAKDASAWMMLGLLQSQRGEDANAVESFKQAEANSQNPLASYYLGQSLVLVGQPDQAVEAYERAITRKPAQTDLLEIFQQLGRVHQRAQRTDKALEAWNRLEKLFPNDARVQEQIAVTLVEEGQPALALPRYELLAKITRDDYRKTTYRVEVAELKVKLGKAEEGIKDLEAVMAGLNPDSWLHREVRRRIEEVFLRTDDQDGLVKYYEKWIAGHKEDVDSMARLARVLARAARVPEATTWLDKALKLAPTRKELRLAFIEQLVDDQRFAEAVAQYEALDKVDANNPDYVREWGKLILKDKSKTLDARKAAAEKVWRKLIAARPKDALIATQVADLFRQSDMKDQALELYKKSVELAPDDPQYREYLGEYHHLLKQPEEALKVWKEIATGKRRTAENVARLAEVYSGFGYAKEAMAEIAAACKLDSKDFSLQLKASDYHTRGEKYDEALAFVAAAQKLAANEDEKEEVLQQQIKVYQAKLTLEDEIEKLVAATKKPAATTGTFYLLARYYEANRQYPEASQTIAEALKREPKSIPSLAAAARIEEQGGNLLAAADLNRQLGNIDRRSRTDYLMSVARLEQQLGRKDEALQAGRDVIAAAPGNTENYEFFAQLCFRLGNTDEGLETLRRAVRINPTEPKLGLALAAALAEQLRTDEAIQVYWQAFEKVTEMEDKLQIVQKLTDSYTQLNQFDKLVERLERDRREEEKRREMTICLSQAYHSSGDYGTARQELESLLSENTRDTQLLQQLSKLSEEENDLAAAIKYQEQLAKLAPGAETEYRLAQLLQKSGANEEATALLLKLTQREQDPEKVLRSIDQLMASGQWQTAIALTEPILRDQPRNWEVLYREGVSFVSSDRPAEAAERFKRILALTTPLEELGIKAAAARKQALAKAKSNANKGLRAQPVAESSVYTHLGEQYQIRYAVGLQTEDYYGGQQAIWVPQMYVAARTASNGWLLVMAQKNGKSDEFLAELRKSTIDNPKADERALIDYLCLQTLRNDGKEIFAASKLMAKKGTLPAKQHYLTAVQQRTYSENQEYVEQESGPDGPKDRTPPLADEDLALLLDCYKAVTKSRSPDQQGASFNFVQSVAIELRRAKREAEADQMIKDVVDNAKEPPELAMAMSFAATKGDMAQVQSLFDRWSKATLAQGKKAAQQAYYSENAQSYLRQMMGLRGADKNHADVLALYDQYLAFAIADANARRAAAKPGRRSTGSQAYYGYGINFYYGKNQEYAQLDYPSANDYVDYNLLNVLRNAYEIFKRNDVDSDLVAHLKKRVEVAAPQAQLYERLCLGYVLWWTDERDEALTELRAAADLLPQDLNMRMELAQLQEAQGNFDDALQMLDAITPLDQASLQKRETMALQLAERLGDVDRARLAAERMFGLRLDSDTQLQLAQRMRRLGMDKLAEAVTARAQRQAGNKTSSLLTLMTHYQGLGRVDLATQLAHTILRRSTTPAAAIGRRGSSSGDEGSRQQALALLSQSGALKEMIARTEAQVKQSNDPSGLYATLAEYYSAIGERDKAMDLRGKILQLRPDDQNLRYAYAQQLEQSNKRDEACAQYLIVLQKRPELLSNNFYQINQAFQRANKTAELAAALEKIDMKQMRSPWYVMDVATNMLRQKDSRDVGMKLFKRVFEAYPNYRRYLINRLYDDELWNMPEVYELSKQGIIPPASLANASSWYGMSEVYSYSGEGKIETGMSKVLAAVARQNKYDDLRKEVNAAMARFPEWHGGKILLALMDFKQGKKDEAKNQLLAVVKDEKVLKAMPSQTRWIIGQELENFADMQDVVIKLYQDAFESGTQQNDFQYTPGMRLVTIYAKSGRKEDARKLLLKALERKTENYYDRDYNAYRRVQSGLSVADQLLKLEFTVDALKIYRDVLSDPQSLAIADRWYGNGTGYMSNQAKKKLTDLLKSMTNDKATEVVMELLKPAAKPATAKAGDVPPAIDLMLTVPSRELDKSQLQSTFTLLMKDVLKNAKVEATLNESVVKLATENKDDLSAQVVSLLLLHETKKTDELAAGLPALTALLEKTPLEAIPEGKRPNSRQRNEALKQVTVWLLARELLADEKFREPGNVLGERALAAARRQIDTTYSASILHEWGQVALKHGDRKLAEEKWTQLLELVTERPKPKKARPMGDPTSQNDAPQDGAAEGKSTSSMPPLKTWEFKAAIALARRAEQTKVMSRRIVALTALVVTAYQAAEPAPAAAAPQRQAANQAAPAAAPAGQGDRVPPITVSQFNQAIQLAKLAAQNDMPQLSLKAVRQALAGGAPLPDLNGGSEEGLSTSSGRIFRSGGRIMTATLGGGSNAETLGIVAGSLRELSSVWESKNIPADDVYAILKPIVFPEERNTEILLYTEALQPTSGPQQSLGATLVTWAVRADKVDDLRKSIASRNSLPAAKLAGLVLSVQLALKEKDTAQAKAGLAAIREHLKTDQVQTSLDVACHAALPAFEQDALADEAFPIVERTIAQFSAQGRDDVGELTRKLTRHLGKRGDTAGAKKQLESFLAAQQTRYSRYGGDYALYLQRQDIATASLEAARSGLPDLALEYLGRFADSPPYRYSDVAIDRQLYLAAKDLLKRPAPERYAFLKEWSLPKPNRRTVRFIAGWTEPNNVPESFLKKEGTAPQKAGEAKVGASTGGAGAVMTTGASLNSEYLSTFDLLIDAARETGKLDELIEELKPSVAEKLLRADMLMAAVLIRKRDREAAQPVIETLLTEFDKRNQQDNRAERNQLMWAEYIIGRMMLETTGFLDLGRRYTDKVAALTQQHQSWNFMTYLRNDVARANIATEPESHLKPGDDPGLKYWFPSTPSGHTLGHAEPWWVVHDGQVSHVSGPGYDNLYFNWPVTGDFEFSADVFNGGWAESDIGYAGIVVESQHRGSPAYVWPIGRHESIDLGEPMEREEQQYNRIHLKVSGGKLRYFLNGYLVYEEAASSTSPWLVFATHFERRTSARNLQLTGNPVIPREVRLTDGNRLEGWICPQFGDRQPSRRLLARISSEGDSPANQRQRQRLPKDFEWDARDGEILGNITPNASPVVQSWLSYHRPLQSGETFKYEFRYEPGKVHVHPALGKLAFMLEPKGVRLHWIAHSTWEFDVLGMGTQDVIEEPAIRRGPAELPLKPNDWNSVELTLKDQTLSITLNGTLVAERAIEPTNDRRFGFFRYRGETSARVRNAVLTGDWPESFTPEVLGNLLAVKSDPRPVDRRVAHAVVTEQFFITETLDVWKHAMRLSPEERYAFLKNWVLPGDDHPTYRLMTASLPIGVDVATLLKQGQPQGTGAAGALADGQVAMGGKDLQYGGVVAPVFLLIDTAREIKKLQELQQLVNNSPAKDPNHKRAQLALQVLLAMGVGDLTVADQRMRELYVHDKPLLAETLPVHERMPEYAVCWRASESPELAPLALVLAQLLVDKHQAKGAGTEWDRLVRELRSRVRWKVDATTANVPYGSVAPGLSQWVIAPFLTARQKGEGLRPSGWRYTRGVVEHLAGGATSRLIFKTPLRGDYEIIGNRSTYGWRETYVAASGIGVDPMYNLQGYWIRRYQRDFQRPDTKLTIPRYNHFADFKIVVKGGQMTVSCNGVDVHTETIPPNADPWLLIESSQVGNLGMVRDLKITGTPQIPESIILSEIDHLSGWRFDSYAGDSLGDGEGNTWKHQGEEIVGNVRKISQYDDEGNQVWTPGLGASRESLATYQRPVVEDGEIEYEYFYVPGEQDVAPAVGSQAFMISPKGVSRHQLTAAQYETSGLAPDNASDIPGAVAPTLKEKDWNKVKLTFRGDEVSLVVNGADVAKLMIPADGMRQFGLFRYSDRTGCRVRKIVYRGDWPKALPKVEDQELAYGPGGFQVPTEDLVGRVAAVLDQPAEKLMASGVKRIGDPKLITTDTRGTRVNLPANQPKKPGAAGFTHEKILKGDFDVSVKFSDLKLVFPKEGYGTGLDFNVTFADPLNTRIALERRATKDGKSVLKAVFAQTMPDGENKYQVWEQELDLAAGTLRMVRQGGRVWYAYAAEGSAGYTLFTAIDVGTADARSVGAICQTCDVVSGVDVVLNELTVKGAP